MQWNLPSTFRTDLQTSRHTNEWTSKQNTQKNASHITSTDLTSRYKCIIRVDSCNSSAMIISSHTDAIIIASVYEMTMKRTINIHSFLVVNKAHTVKFTWATTTMSNLTEKVKVQVVRYWRQRHQTVFPSRRHVLCQQWVSTSRPVNQIHHLTCKQLNYNQNIYISKYTSG